MNIENLVKVGATAGGTIIVSASAPAIIVGMLGLVMVGGICCCMGSAKKVEFRSGNNSMTMER